MSEPSSTEIIVPKKKRVTKVKTESEPMTTSSSSEPKKTSKRKTSSAEPTPKKTVSSKTKHTLSDERDSYSSIAADSIVKPAGKEWVMAIDPGKVNFAFVIEEIDQSALRDALRKCPAERERFQRVEAQSLDEEEKKEAVGDRPKKKRKTGKKRGADMVPTADYTKFLDEFYHCGRTILCANHSLDVPDTVKKRGSRSLSAGVFLQLTEMFDRYRPYLDHCSTIVIEQQMSFGSRINTMAIKIAQHAYSYFLFRYGNAKTIIEFPSYNKTQLLGAPAGLAKPQRKKWAVEKANEIWTLRGDLEASGYVMSKRKKDDMSDCLLHVLAYLVGGER